MLEDIDIRKDLPRYRIYNDGTLLNETLDITSIWRDDLVTFVIGCSFSFEDAMVNAGLRIRHIDQGRNVPMYEMHEFCVSLELFDKIILVQVQYKCDLQASWYISWQSSCIYETI